MTSKAWQGANSRAWRKLRASVLAANVEQHGGACQIALKGSWITQRGHVKACLGVADCVHHTIGRARSGDDPAHLVAACRNCNEKIGDPMAKPARSKRRGGGGSVAVSKW